MAAAPAETVRRRSRRGKIARGLIVVAYGLLGCGYLPETWTGAHALLLPLTWPSFFLRTYLFQVALVVAVVALSCVVFRRWRAALACLPVILLALGSRVGEYVPRRPPPAGTTLRVMSLNVMGDNDDCPRVLAEVQRINPDVICLQEYSHRADAILNPGLAPAYPHNVCDMTTSFRGTAIYSRQPFVAPPKYFLLEPNSGPQWRAEIDFAGRRIAVYCIHLAPPGSPLRFLRQRRGFAVLYERLTHESLPVLVCGDCNFTNNCAAADTLGRLDLLDINYVRGAGRQVSWPYRGKRMRLFPTVRIDHIFLSHELSCSNPTVGENVASDHRPVFADIGFLP